jgi:nicotinamidase-related amidase
VIESESNGHVRVGHVDQLARTVPVLFPRDVLRGHYLEPRPDEPVVTKRRVSAFTGSDVDVLLRGADADSLVLAGISTSGVVLSTLRQAADLDYRLTVLADACGDGDPEVHRVLTEKVFPRQAVVTTTAAWIGTLG